VVERTHSWLNRSRRLLVRWEKKAENYLAFIHLACAQLVFGKLLRLSPGGTP
jgi:putative transposase